MTLKEQLMQDLKDAMKNKDAIKKDTVQMSRAAILQIEKDKKIELDDEGVIEVIAKELKKRKDALPDYEKSGRQDLIESLHKEIKVLEAYLPVQLTSVELEVIVKEAITSTGAASIRDMGKVMAEVMPKIKGRADGKSINEIAKKYLQ